MARSANWLTTRTAVSARSDGYRADSPIFAFQREIETSFRPDYSALRTVLAKAREDSSLSLNDLHSLYIQETSK